MSDEVSLMRQALADDNAAFWGGSAREQELAERRVEELRKKYGNEVYECALKEYNHSIKGE